MMLKIRREQFEALQLAAADGFVIRLAGYVRKKHSDVIAQLPDGTYTVSQLSEEQLREMVQSGIARAQNYGITWESGLSAFVVLMFVVAPNFDEHPLIEKALKDRTVESNARIDKLWEQTSEEIWNETKQNYDAGAWNLKAQ